MTEMAERALGEGRGFAGPLVELVRREMESTP
jgi:hypothetical protein